MSGVGDAAPATLLDVREPGRAHAVARRALPLLGVACLAVLVAAGCVIAVSAAGDHTWLDPAARRGTRGWIDGPLAGLSFGVTPGGIRVEIAVMAAAYAGALALAPWLRARWVVAAVVLAHAAFLLAPAMLSTDVFNYVDYARLGAVHGLDPYVVVPGDVPRDAIYTWVHWRSTRDAYGPLFTLGSYPLAYLGPAGALWAFKALAAAASLGCVALVWRIAERRGLRGATAAAIFGLNPLLLVWTVGGAHNDLLMLLAMVAGVWWVVSGRPARGGAAIVAGAAIKATAGVVLPFALLGARGRRGRLLAGAAGAALVVVLAAYLAFPSHAVGMVDVLRSEQRLVSTYGVPTAIAQLFGAETLTQRARLISEIFAICAVATLAVRVWRGADWVGASGWAFLALVVSASWLLPWYAVWPLPLAAVTRDRRLLLATLAVQTYVVANEVSLFR